MDTNKTKIPYLSLIMPSRNDNHGGNMFDRMTASINGLLKQLEKYHIESELIFVEWNPPENKPLLKDIIKWPHDSKYCTIKAIQVPSSIHRRLPYSDKMPIYVCGAINCGIRRARGKFILPTPIDLLYSNELISFIASKRLRKDERYRVNRCDVNKGVLQCKNLKEQLEYCKKNIIRIYNHKPYKSEGLPHLHTNASGDFQLMSKQYWHALKGYKEGDIISSYVDALLSYASFAAGIKEVILKDPICLYHIDHDDQFVSRIKIQRPLFYKFLSSIFNSMRPFIPAHMGSKIVFLYHKIVGSKSKSTAFGIPVLDYIEYLNLARDIVAGRRSCIFNDNNWGLGQEILPECTIITADWDKSNE